ncbi:hypothetical protein PI124_g4446 [Phytophthora idaei]|nr:hypothetical protein PI125_g21826 [Phytophthora idaei]KAG3130060.1 hypothetical protein PI126_g20669 [Phytophthora idaei]KAG3250940.1 hypothetical protein PI124_g4446 [Phytophthora idaei]
MSSSSLSARSAQHDPTTAPPDPATSESAAAPVPASVPAAVGPAVASPLASTQTSPAPTGAIPPPLAPPHRPRQPSRPHYRNRRHFHQPRRPQCRHKHKSMSHCQAEAGGGGAHRGLSAEETARARQGGCCGCSSPRGGCATCPTDGHCCYADTAAGPGGRGDKKSTSCGDPIGGRHSATRTSSASWTKDITVSPQPATPLRDQSLMAPVVPANSLAPDQAASSTARATTPTG